jgi:fucose permease
MDKKILGLIFLLLALVQIFIALRITRIKKPQSSKPEMQVDAEAKRLTYISRALQVAALLVFVLYIFLKG